MADTNDFNQKVIKEFRARGGEVGGPFEGRPLLLLTTKGRRTGRDHTVPVMYRREGDNIYVFASKGGAPSHPDWYRNLEENPRVVVEMGNDRFEADAYPISSREERDQVFARQAEEYPQFGEYQAGTERIIPVVVLKPVPSEDRVPAARSA
ncbi:MAG: nitroreductase family deazaflavin-dependent oxidoreductase [Actinomycetota bacterium]